MLPCVALVAWRLGRQILDIRLDDPDDCLARFRANRGVGLVVLLAILAGKISF